MEPYGRKLYDICKSLVPQSTETGSFPHKVLSSSPSLAPLKRFGVDIRQVYARHAMRNNASIQKHSDLWSDYEKKVNPAWPAECA